MKSAVSFKRSVPVTLPKSCIEVELQKPDVARLTMENADTGEIPEPLVARMTSAINQKSKNGEWKPSEKDLPGISRFMDLIVRATFRWPVIVRENPDYDNGQILITDLEPDDRMFVFNWAMPEGFLEIDSFRGEQSPHVPPAPVLQTVRSTAKRPTKHRG